MAHVVVRTSSCQRPLKPHHTAKRVVHMRCCNRVWRTVVSTVKLLKFKILPLVELNFLGRK
jgi:hypothetical protein